MRTHTTIVLALLLMMAATLFWACNDDHTPTLPAAPCAIALPLSAIPDSCFDLPQGPTGSNFNAPFDYRYATLSASTSEAGVFYYVRGDYQLGQAYTNQKIFKHNICTGVTTLVYEIIGGSDSANFSVNGEGEILFQRRPSQPILLASANIQPPVEVLPAGDYLRTRWMNNDSFIISRWIGGNNFEPLVVDQLGNVTIAQSDIFNNSVIAINDNKVAVFFRSGIHQGYLGVYDLDTEELTLIEDLATNYNATTNDFSGIMWLNDETLLGYFTVDRVFKYNLNTRQMVIVKTNGNCRNQLFSGRLIKLKDREDIVLLSRLDYIYNAAGEYRMQYRISVLDIATGEEQILELE